MPRDTQSKRIVHQRAKGPIDPSFGARVAALRRSRGMTQAALAGSDFTKGFVSLVETGRSRVSLRAATIIARRLDVSVSDLMGSLAGSERDVELALLRAEQLIASGQVQEAAELAAQFIARAHGPERARLQRVRARALIETARSREAITLLDQALREFRARNQREMVVRTTFDLARAHFRIDEYAEATQLAMECERALNAGELVDRTLELQVLRLLSNVLVSQGDFESAELRAERALVVAQDIADPDALAKLYSGMALSRHEQGDFEAAITYARRSLDQFERIGQQTAIAETWNTLGWMYIQRRHLGRAAEALDKAERMAKDGKNADLLACILGTRAELALARGSSTEAVALAERSIKETNPRGHCRPAATLIRAQALLANKGTSLPEIKRAFEAAIEAYENQPRRRQARVHEAYAVALAQRGRIPEAFAQRGRALELMHAPASPR